jgi:hypothetical protein
MNQLKEMLIGTFLGTIEAYEMDFDNEDVEGLALKSKYLAFKARKRFYDGLKKIDLGYGSNETEAD